MTEVLTSVAAMRNWRQAGRSLRGGVALVPTMGALHEGHLTLVRAAQRESRAVVVSIFVNPLQFGPHEDLDRYPRDLAADLAQLESLHVQAVFHPGLAEMYPDGPSETRVVVESLAGVLSGRARPGHFSGVATVVAKLFNIVEPDMAFFGCKDWQQLVIIRRMARDLNFSVRIVGVPTVREPNGLARSSRNTYLSAAEREQAASIYAGLLAARESYDSGERRAAVLVGIVSDTLGAHGLSADYVELVHPVSLASLPSVVGDWALLAVAVPVGRARLIDNIELGQAPNTVRI